MKRTLFNTMMGCLAALSLAGCGGSDSGGGSSTVPSERLISEGYRLVLRSNESGDKVSYAYVLESDGKCLFSPHETEDMDIIFTGRWSEESLGGEKFRITFSDFSKTGDPLNLNCEIDFTTGPITLTITDMSAYRAGQPVTASFDQAPFTHEAGTNCPDTETAAGTGLMLRMVPVSSSGSSGSDLQ